MARVLSILLNLAIAGTQEPIAVRGPVGAREVVDGITATYRLDLGYRVAHHGDKFAAEVMNPVMSEHAPGIELYAN